MDYKYYNRTIRHHISFIFIWFMIIPIILFHLCLEVYHHICFPLYGIKLLRITNYVKMDRYKLKYLSLFDRVNCNYCGYANGVMHYAKDIAAETEKYWCGIKHQDSKGYVRPEHHKNFVDYGDEKALHKKYSHK